MVSMSESASVSQSVSLHPWAPWARRGGMHVHMHAPWARRGGMHVHMHAPWARRGGVHVHTYPHVHVHTRGHGGEACSAMTLEAPLAD